ncbi:MAG: cell division transport system permease protein [Acidimicrobiia bacterium]|nr:cell division transport system permease protein [Acidimicrobiia bacterium]
MALKINYVARETGSNLWRNISLTVASMLTVAVSLSLFGGAQIIYHGIGNATARWKGGIEFIVFMNPTANDDQLASVRKALESSPEVRKVEFVDKTAAYEEFRTLFARQPELLDAVDQNAMPPSFKVAPASSDADVISALGKQFENDPGVREVVFAFETVRTMQRFSQYVRWGILGVSVVLMVAALMLILNTIRMAMFARRREIEVMKLVGATNWFIRVPFMLEGLIQGVLGAFVAMGTTWVLKRVFDTWLSNNQDLRIFQGFAISSGQLVSTWVLLLFFGCLVGTLGSGLAVSRYLDV